ncbi:MAG TPA: c-type cytochrome [Verrucomicrobiae bacterium]|jgi:mono/diheme cytochrome c family protein|nr:c-type cytochrome [Verrucomicrobiae bacterium]
MTRLLRILFAAMLAAWTSAAAEMPGIVCTATDGERTVTFVAPTANFTLEPSQSIHPQLKPDFKAEWSGFLKIARAGKYRLILTDGKDVLGQQTLNSERGLMPVHLTYERKPGQVEQQLWWESETFRAEPIPYYAYAHTNDPADTQAASQSERARELIENLNCVACHRTDNPIYRGRAAPDLSQAGARLQKNWIYHWLKNPRHFQAAAAMPILLRTDQECADVAAYLATLSSAPLAKPAAPIGETGKAVFDRLGCVGCHDARGVVLGGEGSKYQPGALANYLLDPLACDPSGRMPGQFLSTNEASALAQFLMESHAAEFEQPGPDGDAARGKALAASRGCLNCHTLIGGASTLTATPLLSLHGTGGCLAAAPDGKAPHFDWTTDERAALAAFLATPDVSAAPVQDVSRWIDQFRCAACHAWHGKPELNFGRNQEPPALSDAGAKLRRSWLEEVLTTTNRVRPWITARMPHYGADNVAGFLDGFAEQAGASLGEGSRITNPRVDLADEGMHYIGTDDEGLSCITCHDFRGEPSHGDLHSPDLTGIDDRLRTDWVQRWLFEPSRITPGTAMPDMLASKPSWESEKIVHRLLQALAMGPKMADPPGWHEAPGVYHIIVGDKPVVQRCLLPDVSARAIAVGLPGKVSYAFDAETCQLRYAWTGEFLDAKPTWTWRGGLPPRVLGRKFSEAPYPGPLRFQKRATPVPKFLGYDLAQGWPRFNYEIDGVKINLSVTNENQSLICAYEVIQPRDAIWFNAGAEAVVTADPAPARGEDDWWKIPPGNTVKFSVRLPIK